jgi:hypothetical protein
MIGAIDEAFPLSLRQRCLVTRSEGEPKGAWGSHRTLSVQGQVSDG